MAKTIRVSEDTHKQLGEIGTKADSYEDVIIFLLSHFKTRLNNRQVFGGKRK